MKRLTPFASPAPAASPLRGALAWLWLFAPVLWMWPGRRSALEVVLSAVLFLFCLLWRGSTRMAVLALLLAGCSFLGYFFAVRSAPDEFFWFSVLGSNATEAWEYASSYRLQDWVLLLSWLLPALAAAGYLWRTGPLLRRKWARCVGWISLAVWLVWAGVSLGKGYALSKAVARVERVYPLTMLNAWLDYLHNGSDLYVVPEVAPPVVAPMVDVLVVVLGESSSAHRWSMLGYQRHDTNAPLQDWRDGLVVLPVTANGNNTGKTLPVLVTGQRMHPMPEGGAATYLDWARAAGFRRDSLTNQMAAGFVNLALRQRSDHFLQLQDGSFDGALSEHLARSLAGEKKPLLVTLHMYGSHPRVERRVPEGAGRWDDAYDNSTLYTSQLLADWMGQLNALPGVRAALVYASDHGQDFPVCGGSYTHGVTRSTYEVPLMVWANQALREAQPAWWQQLQQVQASAVDGQGIPRYTSLMMAQWLKVLLGQSPVPQPTSASGWTSTAGAGNAAPSGHYPPPESRSDCGNWNAQVQRLHPAAVR